MRKRYLIAGFYAALVLGLDQTTKAWVQKNIGLFSTREIIPGFFNLVHTLNKGAAFGFLNRDDIHWQTYFFIGATVFAMLLVAHLLRSMQEEDKILTTGLGLILGGASGNLVDRIRFGEVVDFLDVYFRDWHWPAFNVADIAISLGAIAMIISFYVTGRREGKDKPLK